MSSTGIDSDGEHIPAGFKLSQNYPNPFNPATNIEFTLISESEVRLVIYDILGRHVSTIVDGEMYSAGSHTVRWNGLDVTGREAAGGVYIYSITTGAQTENKKMVLIR